MVRLRRAKGAPLLGCQRGALSVPLALLVSATLTLGMGTWGLLRHWRMLVEVQLRLDRCTGQAAQELKTAFERIQALNRAIQAARAALVAGAILPEAAAAAKEALQIAYAAQELAIAAWHARRAYWMIRQGCGESGDSAEPLPSLPWTRDLPDVLGPKPLRWTSESTEFRIRARNRSRHAAAKLVGEKGATDAAEPKRWSLEWTI